MPSCPVFPCRAMMAGGQVVADCGGLDPIVLRHSASQGFDQGQLVGRCRPGRRCGRTRRAGTLTMGRRSVDLRATAWAVSAMVRWTAALRVMTRGNCATWRTQAPTTARVSHAQSPRTRIGPCAPAARAVLIAWAIIGPAPLPDAACPARGASRRSPGRLRGADRRGQRGQTLRQHLCAGDLVVSVGGALRGVYVDGAQQRIDVDEYPYRRR